MFSYGFPDVWNFQLLQISALTNNTAQNFFVHECMSAFLIVS